MLKLLTKTAAVLFAVSLLLASTPSHAQTGQIIDATEPQQLLTIAQKYGSARLDVDREGDPLIFGTIDGTDYLVVFYGCQNGAGCRNIQFYAYWKYTGTMEKVNEFNATRRFVTAAIDSDGDLSVTYDVNLDYGVTPRNFDDTVDWWRVMIGRVREHFSL